MAKLSISKTTVTEPCPADFNLAAYVMLRGRITPDKVALEICGAKGVQSWTFAELERAILHTAGQLAALELPTEARILLRVGNTVEFPLLYLAAIAAGYVPVPCSLMLTEPEVRVLIEDLEPALICLAPEALALGVVDSLEISASRLVNGSQDSLPEYVFGDPNRLGYIVYTSGTSGKPRAVMHAHRAIWARRMMWDGWYGLRHDDRLLHAGAFNWTYTLGTGLFDPWAKGATALIVDGTVDRNSWPDVIRTSQATLFAAAPGIFRQILSTDQSLQFSDLRHALSAGEKLTQNIRQAWTERSGTEVYEAYGMSEASTFISSGPFTDFTAGSLGRPQVGRGVAILAETDHSVQPVNTPGVLALSRDDGGLMLGYLNAPRETADKFSGDWFLTGDVASMDADGNIFYHGRGDDMMNAGGYRVSPLEVENVLDAYLGIAESAAAAVEIKRDTFVIAAFYQSTAPIDADDLKSYCITRLAKYKRPRLFIRLDALPKNPNGKLRRSALKSYVKVSYDQA